MEGLFLSLSPKIRITPHRFHELHRAKPGGKRAKPGDNAHAACCGIFRATAQTGRIGIFTGSLARVPDGSGTARCVHGVGVHIWCAVRVSGLARVPSHHFAIVSANADGNLDGADGDRHYPILPGANNRAHTLIPL